MVRVSVNRFVSQRIETIRREVEPNIQRLREKTIRNLEEIFRMARKIARGEIKRQRINGKMVRIGLNQRRRWLQVAAHAAETIKSVATNFDEQGIRAQLNELERLVKEADMGRRYEKSQKGEEKSGNKPT